MTLQDGTTTPRRRCRQTSGWTDERVAILRRCMTAGMSASQIARELGGVTRNGVIGKIHRLNLTNRKIKAPANPVAGPKPARMHNVLNHLRVKDLSRPTPERKNPFIRPQPPRVKIRPGANTSTSKEIEVLPATEITDLAPDASPFACTIIELKSGMCRWPLSEDIRAMSYCGAPCVGSWCGRHRAIVFTKERA